jgi:hypothetical protein
MIFEWHDDGWRKRFAFLPVFLSDGPVKQVVWWRWFWAKDCGLYRAISLTDPRAGGDND